MTQAMLLYPANRHISTNTHLGLVNRHLFSRKRTHHLKESMATTLILKVRMSYHRNNQYRFPFRMDQLVFSCFVVQLQIALMTQAMLLYPANRHISTNTHLGLVNRHLFSRKRTHHLKESMANTLILKVRMSYHRNNQYRFPL